MRNNLRNWLHLIRIFSINFSTISIAITGICWEHLTSSEGHRYLYSCGRREPYRRSLNLHYSRLHVLGYGYAYWGIRLFFLITIPFHRLHWRRNNLGCKLLICSCSNLLSHGWTQKSSWLSGKISYNTYSYKPELPQLALVWAIISSGLWLIFGKLKRALKPLCDLVHLERKGTLTKSIAHVIKTI